MLKSVRACLILPIVFFACAASARGASITVGQADSGYCVPFGCSPGSIFQQAFDASLFADVFNITGLDFFNTLNNGAGDRHIDPAHYELWISTTSAQVLNTTDFAVNRGADQMLVFSGPLGGSPEGELPPGPDTRLSFSWTTAFRFDPRNGNLLVEVRKTGGTFIGDDGVYLDFDQSLAGVSHVSNFAGSEGRNNFSQGLVTELSGTFGEGPPAPNPVPEPATLLLLGSGLAGIAIRRRRGRV